MNTHLEKIFRDRLISLSDGRPGLRTVVPVTVHAPRSDAPRSDVPVLDFIASDETLDRYDEVISAAGWRLENYRRNPVFQNSHQYGDIIFTLGKALVTEVRSVASVRSVLFQRIQFATDVNPMARIAYGLYKGGFLNAVSVGFVPLRWEDLPARSAECGVRSEGPSVHSALRTPQSALPRRRYLEQELLEVSSVAVPANPNALVLGLKSGAIEAGDLRDLAELVKECMCGQGGRHELDGRWPAGVLNSQLSTFNYQPFSRSKPADSAANTRDLGGGVNESRLLQLARDLREILTRA
jgi:hypothetical protein